MTFNDVAKKLSYKFQSVLSLDEPSREIIEYSLIAIISTFISIASMLIIGWLVGAFWPTLTVGAVGAILRVFSGGAHCTTPGRCAAAGAVFTPFLGLIALHAAPLLGIWNYAVIIPCGIWVLAVMAARSPDQAPEKPIAPRRRPILRRRSLICAALLWCIAAVAIWLPISRWWGMAIALGICWQGVTLTPAGHGFVGSVDSLLSRWIRI